MNSKEPDRTESIAGPGGETAVDRETTTPSATQGFQRRTVLRSIGGVAVAGLLAGCSGDGEDGTGDQDSGSGADSVDDWLANTGNYDGVTERTDASSVTVEVGAQGNSGANAFAPAAIEILPGTTVAWEWVDGYHNVVAVDGEFNSGAAEQNVTFQHTFDSPGTYLYYCEPHRSIDMKGAVVVPGGDDGGSENASNGSNSG